MICDCAGDISPASRPDSALCRKNVYGFIAYLSIAALLSGFVPLLAHSAADRDHYAFQEEGKTISYLDLSAAFGKNTGSFVLYNAGGIVPPISAAKGKGK